VTLCDAALEWGDDLRKLPLHFRKADLQRLLARRPEGNPHERGEIGPELFRAACRMGLEGQRALHAAGAYRPFRADVVMLGCKAAESIQLRHTNGRTTCLRAPTM
jgi:ATP-dependent DNA ligase